MQRRKIAVACLSLLLVGLALPSANINKAHAFTNGNNTVTVSNVLANFIPPPSTTGFGVTVAQAGTTLSVAIVVQASTWNTPAYTRNVTIGFKGDWQVSYQNTSITPLTTSQVYSTTLAVTLPSAGSFSAHSWNVEIWDGPATGNVSGCTAGDAENFPGSGTAKSCFSIGSGSFTLLTADQYSAAQARSGALAAVSGVGFVGLSNSAAEGQLIQAVSERNLGDQSWASGDFASAKTHYQNSQTDANAAIATQVNLGGTSTNAGIVSVILSGTGIALFGIGVLLAGIGGFFYLKRKPKA
jgi:hypothetical protein